MGTEVDIWKTATKQLTAALYSSRASVIAEPRGKPKDSFVLIGCPVLGSRLGALGQRPSFRPQLSACGRGWRVEQPMLKTRVNVVKTKAANLLVSRRCASLSSKSGMFEPELSIG